MFDRDNPTDGIERRSVLAAVATGLGGVGVARSSLADAQDGHQYVVEQDGQCVPITPLSGDETVEEFYDYRTPNTEPSGDAYSSYGTTDLQRSETSICFLYDGPEGLSLVVVHDELEDGTNGGAVTFDLRLENPDRGSWVVGDDDYDAESNYDTFEETTDGWQIDWTWSEGRSDGGAYRPLGDEFAVTIDPAFNEDAELYGEHYEGEITDWEVLSGDRSDPDRTSLVLDQPLTIRPGGCDGRGTTTTTTRETTTEEETTTEGEETTTEEDTTTEEEDTTTEDDSEEEQSSGTVRADVEIVPGRVNPRSRGRLPVVVYSTADFDATALASGSVAFGPGDANPVNRTRTDEDGDGRADLKLHFRLGETGIDWDTDRLRLTGETASGRAVVGDAEVRLVPAGDDEDEDDDDDDDNDDDESEEREREEEDEDEREDGGEDEQEDDETEREREREEEDDDEGDDDDEDDDDDDSENSEDGESDDDEWWGDDDDDDGWWDDGDDDDRDDDDDEGWGDDDWGDDDDGRGNDGGRGRGRGNGRGEGNDRGNGRGRGNGRDDRDEDD